MVRCIRAAAVGLLAVATSCELGSTALPPATPSLVVHAVLDPDLREQQVLVEESLSGDLAQDGRVSPVTGAIVSLTAPDGMVMTAREIGSGDESDGLYVFDLDIEIVRGGRYQLSVAARGRTVTGTTVVPDGGPASAQTVSFNRDHDTVHLSIPEVPLARAYWMRLEAPFAAYSLFTNDREVAIRGDARNFFADDLTPLFFPGFVQTLTVAAMDSNLYDYYRSASDPFSGVGLINRLEGGFGVFGSIATVVKREIAVTQDPTGDPIEGEYTRRTESPSELPIPDRFRLYLESRGSTSDQPDRISGNFVAARPERFEVKGAVLGTRAATAIELQINLSQGSTDNSFLSFRGVVRGDTLRGGYGSNYPATYVRVGK
jgi:hypothetical protein